MQGPGTGPDLGPPGPCAVPTLFDFALLHGEGLGFLGFLTGLWEGLWEGLCFASALSGLTSVPPPGKCE